MLERLFTSKSRIKILQLLIFNTQSEFHLRQIARLTDVSPPYVKRELSNLSKINLITESTKGNLKLFKINKNSPIFYELKRIFLKTESLGNLLKKKLKSLELRYAMIYGSFAASEETERSDIDLLVIGNIKEERILEIITESEAKVGREINYILWSEKEFEKRARQKHHLLVDIVSRPIIMLVGDENEFRKTVKRQKNRTDKNR
jgi:predicted nucleotidyltransferase